MQDSLDFKMVLEACLLKVKWIITMTVLFMIFSFLISTMLLSPKYESYVLLFVNNSAIGSGNQLNLDDISSSQKLLRTYAYLLTDDEILDEVAEQMGHPYTADKLRDVLRTEALAETMILRITAKTTDALVSADICNKMAEVAPGVLQRIVQSGKVEVVGKAKPAQNPSSPNVLRNTLTGGLLGFVLTVFIAVLLRFLDNTVKDERDLKRHIDVPVLGEIPSLDM